MGRRFLAGDTARWDPVDRRRRAEHEPFDAGGLARGVGHPPARHQAEDDDADGDGMQDTGEFFNDTATIEIYTLSLHVTLTIFVSFRQLSITV